MKKVIFAVILTTLFSTVVNANSGLADRINEASPDFSPGYKQKRLKAL